MSSNASWIARALVGARYAALGVLGDDGYITRFPTAGLSATEREEIGAPPRGHGLLGVMLRAGRSLRIPDISRDPRRSGFPPHHPPMTGLLGVPIFVRGQLVGDLYLSDKIGGPEFGEEDERLVELLASLAATALANAQLHEQATRDRAWAEALLRVTQAISRSVQLDEVIDLILHTAVEALHAAGAAVYLLTPGAAAAKRPAPADWGGDRYALGLVGGFTTAIATLPMDRTVAGRVAATGATQVVADTCAAPDTVFPQLAGGRELRSLAAVPLRRGAPILGVLSLYSDRPAAFPAAAVQLLEALGAQASTALHNASLYEAAERGRRAAEAEQARLRELEQMKDEFLSTAAHELRTPLTTIRMAAGLALEQLQLLATRPAPGLAPLDARLVELVQLAVESSERMQALVNDLLDLTSLEQGRTGLAMVELDLREVIAAAAAVMQPLFASKGQPLIFHLPEARYQVRGDRARLEQVLINLLSNAHKYAPPGAEVEVRAARAGAECRIAVRDSGPGVPAAERERIFERFYRSSLHREGRTASTGLGLPIARTIAELHHGRLWVEPAPGGGSVFILALPLVP